MNVTFVYTVSHTVSNLRQKCNCYFPGNVRFFFRNWKCHIEIFELCRISPHEW